MVYYPAGNWKTGTGSVTNPGNNQPGLGTGGSSSTRGKTRRSGVSQSRLEPGHKDYNPTQAEYEQDMREFADEERQLKNKGIYEDAQRGRDDFTDRFEVRQDPTVNKVYNVKKGDLKPGYLLRDKDPADALNAEIQANRSRSILGGIGEGIIGTYRTTTTRATDTRTGDDVTLSTTSQEFGLAKDKVVTGLSLMPEMKFQNVTYDKTSKGDIAITLPKKVDYLYSGQTVASMSYKRSGASVKQSKFDLISSGFTGLDKTPGGKMMAFSAGLAYNIKTNVVPTVKNYGVSAGAGILYQGVKVGGKRLLTKYGAGVAVGAIPVVGQIAEIGLAVGLVGLTTYKAKKGTKNYFEFGFNMAQPVVSMVGFGTGVGVVGAAESSYMKSIVSTPKSGKVGLSTSMKYKRILGVEAERVNVKSIGFKGKGMGTGRVSATEFNIPVSESVSVLKLSGKGYGQTNLNIGKTQYSTFFKKSGKTTYTGQSQTTGGITKLKLFKNGKMISSTKAKGGSGLNIKVTDIASSKTKPHLFQDVDKGILLKTSKSSKYKIQTMTNTANKLRLDIGVTSKKSQVFKARVNTPELQASFKNTVNLDTGTSKIELTSIGETVPKLQFVKGKANNRIGSVNLKDSINIDFPGTYRSTQNTKYSVSGSGTFETTPMKSIMSKGKGAQLSLGKTKTKGRISVGVSEPNLNIKSMRFGVLGRSSISSRLSMPMMGVGSSGTTKSPLKDISLFSSKSFSSIRPNIRVSSFTQSRARQKTRSISLTDTTQISTSSINSIGNPKPTTTGSGFGVNVPMFTGGMPGLNLGNIGQGVGVTRRKKGKKAKGRYNPSILGLDLGLKSGSKSRVLTGFEVRGA